MPLYLIEGALLLALACEQRVATLHLQGGSAAQRALLDEVGAELERLGILGAGGWAGGICLRVTDAVPPRGALDALTARVLPVALWQGGDPATTIEIAAGESRDKQQEMVDRL